MVRGGDAGARKPLVIRAIGPGLSSFGFGAADVVFDPRIDVFAGQAQDAPIVLNNEDWGGSFTVAEAMRRVGAFPLLNPSSPDSVVVGEVASGDYVVRIGGPGRRVAGYVLAELYDASPSESVTAATPRLVNVSVLYRLGAGEDLIAGFVISGGAKRVLIRAVGPGLAPFAVTGAMADPQLTLARHNVPTTSNDNWGGAAELTAAMDAVGAFRIANPSSADAMLLATLEPGDYTARARGVGSSGGAVLVEVYEVP